MTTILELSLVLPGAALVASANTAFGQSTAAQPESSSGMSSLLTVAPASYDGSLRGSKFYIDPNVNRDTLYGPLVERQYLLGSLGGARDTWTKNGWLVTADVTQAVQGVMSPNPSKNNAIVVGTRLQLDL